MDHVRVVSLVGQLTTSDQRLPRSVLERILEGWNGQRADS